MKLVYKGHEELEPSVAYQTEHSAGLDLVCQQEYIVRPFGVIMIATGMFLEEDEDELDWAGTTNYYMYIVNRSSTFINTPLIINSSPIDPDYRDEIRIVARNVGDTPYKVNVGSRIAQLVILPRFYQFPGFPVIKVKRSGGFGSTDGAVNG